MLKSSKKIWIVESAKRTPNRKYNAGASRSIFRAIARVKRIKSGHGAGFKIITDVPSVAVKSGRCSLLFLPSDVIIKKGIRYVVCSYDQLTVYPSTVNFIENGFVPRDAEVVRYTWQYVNKDGTADLRFNKNRRLPVCRYGLLHFIAGSKISIELQTSAQTAAKNAGNAYHHYRSYINAIGSEQPLAADTPDAFQFYAGDDALQSIYEELNRSTQEIGRELADGFSEDLSCKISYVDGQYYDDHAIFYYTVSGDAYNTLPIFEKTMNEKGQKIRMEMVSNNSFLVHLYNDPGPDFSRLNLELSPILSKAMEEAKKWTAMQQCFPDDMNNSKDTNLIDDMLMFLDEE